MHNTHPKKRTSNTSRAKRRHLGYTLLTFEVVMSSWEWLFLFYLSFKFIGSSSSGIQTALLFLIFPFTRVLTAKLIAHHLEKFNASTRFALSILARLALLLVVTSILIYDIAGQNKGMFFAAVSLIAVLQTIDTLSMTTQRYTIEALLKANFLKMSAFSNIGRRGVIALASIFAYTAHTAEPAYLFFLSITPFTFGIISSAATLALSITRPNHTAHQLNVSRAHPEKSGGKHTNTAIFHLAILVLTLDLAFGSLNITLLRATDQHQLVYGSVSILTFLYIGFILMNMVILSQSTRVDHISKKIRVYVSAMLIGALCISLTFLSNNFFFASIACLLIGCAYALTTTTLFSIVSNAIRGQYAVKHNATIDTFSKFGFIISHIVAGLSYDAGLDPLTYAAASGVFALILLTLFFRFRSLD